MPPWALLGTGRPYARNLGLDWKGTEGTRQGSGSGPHDIRRRTCMGGVGRVGTKRPPQPVPEYLQGTPASTGRHSLRYLDSRTRGERIHTARLPGSLHLARTSVRYLPMYLPWKPRYLRVCACVCACLPVLLMSPVKRRNTSNLYHSLASCSFLPFLNFSLFNKMHHIMLLGMCFSLSIEGS